MAARKPVEGLPGFVWVYPGDADMHGFRGRHAYNPNTGASLSLRQTQSVQKGEQRLDQALVYAAHPRKQELVTMKGHRYRVSHFGTIYGAVRYASTRPGQGPMNIAGYGKPTRKYKENEPEIDWRTISDYGNASFYRGKGALESAYARFNNAVTEPSKTPTFSLMERLDI
jgi:hypothetical protein